MGCVCSGRTKAGKGREGDQEMADVGVKVPGASVVGPASRPALDVNTAVNQGADKSTSSSQAPDDMAATNQPTDVITAEGQPADMESVADSKTDNESGDIPDFLLLPLLVWLKIFSILTPRDRLVLSVTCRKLHYLCRDSSVLWRSAVLHIKTNERYTWSKVSATDKSILSVHRNAIQNLTIQMKSWQNVVLEESSLCLVFNAVRNGRLKQLEIRTENSRCSMANTRWQDFLLSCITSPRTSGLSRLIVSAVDWCPRRSLDKSGVVEALKNSSFTCSLTHLYLGMILGDGPTEFWRAIKRFQNLQSLTVPYECMSNSLLDNFPKCLKKVTFIVKHWQVNSDVTNWPQVVASIPQLTAGLHLNGGPVSHVLPEILPSVVPVSSVRIANGSLICHYLNWSLLEALPKCFRNLEMLHYRCFREAGMVPCFHDWLPDHLEEVLIETIRQSPKLFRLNYNGSINNGTVLTLAKMRNWTELVFFRESIIFREVRCGQKNLKLQALCEEVSRILGRSWRLRSYDNDDPVTL